MLPACISPNLASALTGRSDKAIRNLVSSGSLPATDMGGRWVRIPLRAIEELRGSRVSAEEYLLAQQSLEPRREYWRHRRRQERDSETNRAIRA